MRKKLVSGLLAAAMVASLMVGCGKEKAATVATTEEDTAKKVEEDKKEVKEEEEEETPVATTGSGIVSDDGTVLNVLVWDDDFKIRVVDYYPDYEKIDENTGKIGDVEVHWMNVSKQDNAYQDKLDELLQNNIDALEDEKIDLFCIESDYALKYVDSDVTLDVINDIGVGEMLLSNQYLYTKDVVTDINGALKGVTWQGCPGVMIYRRDIAKAVWGTDDPEKIQNHFSSWDDFYTAAVELNAKGYQITASVFDTYRIYSNNVSSKWVDDGKINIEPQIRDWAEAAKDLVDKGYTSTEELKSDEWNEGMQTNSNVFCYFGPAWFVESSMHAGEEGMAATDGLYAATRGPESFFWGGTWVCGANGTDNISLVKDIIEEMTTDEEVLTKIATEKNEFVNNRQVMETIAADTSYTSDILGGQNALEVFCKSADAVSLEYLSKYDQECNEEFQKAMKNWFEGSYASCDEAIEAFCIKIIEKYPELTK